MIQTYYLGQCAGTESESIHVVVIVIVVVAIVVLGTHFHRMFNVYMCVRECAPNFKAIGKVCNIFGDEWDAAAS